MNGYWVLRAAFKDIAGYVFHGRQLLPDSAPRRARRGPRRERRQPKRASAAVFDARGLRGRHYRGRVDFRRVRRRRERERTLHRLLSQAHLFWQQAFANPAFSDAIRKHHGKAVLGGLREHITHVLSAKQMSDGEGRAVDRLTSFAAVSALGANMLVMMFPPRFSRRPATRLDKRKPAFMRVF